MLKFRAEQERQRQLGQYKFRCDKYDEDSTRLIAYLFLQTIQYISLVVIVIITWLMTHVEVFRNAKNRK